jgi:hypothetical protein
MPSSNFKTRLNSYQGTTKKESLAGNLPGIKKSKNRQKYYHISLNIIATGDISISLESGWIAASESYLVFRISRRIHIYYW